MDEEILSWFTAMGRQASVIDFSNEIQRACRKVRKFCNDDHTLQHAIDLVPIAELVQENIEILDGDYKENLLPLLVDWFSSKFFKWFQAPDCEKCKKPLSFDHASENTEGKIEEIYECPDEKCDYTYKFIRHGDPAILLHTRQGRCGEWADCFFTFLKAMDYDARIVHDSTDHVWNEVWSESKQRWVHVDPCENTIDCPLLYEAGWKKKLEYCIAYGQYEVLDVTSRYTIDFRETKHRRKKCQENWLHEHLDEVTQGLIKLAPVQRQAQVLERRRIDKELLIGLASTSRKEEVKSLNFQGRKTGSVAWRIERGEFSPKIDKRYILSTKPNETADQDGLKFFLTYNSDRNSYDGSLAEHRQKGWTSLIYKSENLDFKYERDWKTSYISRYETCPSSEIGLIQWRFDISEAGKWTKIEITIRCEVYPLTCVELNLFSYDSSGSKNLSQIKLACDEKNVITRGQIDDQSKFLDLTAKLSGGDPEDSVAWQKPQLFRQTKGKDEIEPTMTFRIIE